MTPRYHSEHQCTACPLSLTALFFNVSHGLPAYCVLHWLSSACFICLRGSHVSDAEISFGTPVHGLPAFTDGVVFNVSHGLPAYCVLHWLSSACFICLCGSHVSDAEISFGTPVHGLPAFTDGVVFQRQPRPARLLCPPLAIVSVFHMFARLTCQ